MKKTDKAGQAIDRRVFFERAAGGAAALVFAVSGLSLLPRRETAAAWAPKPPGALDGSAFAAACSRCGQCVRACPYDTLKLADPDDPAPLGTPFFEPRRMPCFMCRNIPCARACPTGALEPALEDISQARMGVAVIDPESCLSWQGLRCEVCLRDCPEANRAITIELHPRELSKHAVFVPRIHPDKCTGCGLCEKGCPTDVAAVRIVDPQTVLGAIGEHYRLGWLQADAPKNTRRIRADNNPKRAKTSPEEPDGISALDYLNAQEE